MMCNMKFLVLLSLIASAPVIADTNLQTSVERLLEKLNGSSSDHACNSPTLSLDVWPLLRLAVQQEVKELTKSARSARALTPGSNYPTSQLDTVQLGGKNYFFSKNQKLSWIDSVMFCRLYGMELASIETREEDQLIVKHLQDIGLKPHIVWISGNKIGRSTYIWSNGEPLIFENWHPGSPPHFATEHCMLYQNDHWTDYHCSGHDWHFVCEEK
ncbi:hypothetical protein B566_EDAN013460 [Ephemera danica]|nr:hypothetical protein B566_EDAN013460 [Ephemera danica]